MRVEEIADEYDKFVRDARGELIRIDERAGRSILVRLKRGLIDIRSYQLADCPQNRLLVHEHLNGLFETLHVP